MAKIILWRLSFLLLYLFLFTFVAGNGTRKKRSYGSTALSFLEGSYINLRVATQTQKHRHSTGNKDHNVSNSDSVLQEKLPNSSHVSALSSSTDAAKKVSEKWCVEAFLNRKFLPPVRHKSKIEMNTWKDMHCQELLCENKDEEPCRFTYFALKAILNDRETMKCTTEEISNFEMPKQWELYRFSDLFRNNVKDFNYHTWRTKFPWNSSLFGEYHSEAIKRGIGWRNFDLLYEIVRRRESEVAPPPENTTVIHLRIGDVMGRDYQTVLDLLQHTNLYYPKLAFSHYVKPLRFYSSLPKAENVVLMGGLHLIKHSFEETKSCQYMSVLKRFFEASGSKVYLRLGNPPDKDLLYAAQSKTFVQGGGGFSSILAQLVERSGGKVIGHLQDVP